ncbi:MAG: AsmA family protein [Verrucomicrobia bacterium]|nr:AsmA family protein [Verrucomicrobiota bacterium]
MKLKWKKWLSIAAGALALLAVVGYFVFTSSFFICKVVLPIAGSFLKMEIKADEVKLSGLSNVAIKNLKVTPNGEETILDAEALKLELNKLDISFASFNIKELLLEKGTLNIVQTPEGGNLAAILALMGESDPNKPPLNLLLEKLSVQDYLIKWKKIAEDDTLMGAELRNVNVTGGGLGNELTGKVALSTDMDFYMGSNYKIAPEEKMSGPFSAEINLPLTKELMPGLLNGPIRWDIASAQGMFEPTKEHNITVDMALSLQEIQKLIISYNQENNTLASISSQGALHLEDFGVLLNYEVDKIDSRFLNEFSEPFGVKFENAKINSKGTFEIADSLNLYKLKNQTQITDLVLAAESSTQVVSLESDLDLTANLEQQTLNITKLYAKGLRGEKEFLATQISQPVLLGWGKSAPEGAVDSSIHSKLSLDLADWRGFIGDESASGQLITAFDMEVKEKGTRLECASSLTLSDISTLGYHASGEIRSQNLLLLEENSSQISGNLEVNQLKASIDNIGITNFTVRTDYEIQASLAPALEIKNMDIRFTPTLQAKNNINIKGKFDLSPEGTPSSLNVLSDGLDLTPILHWVQALSTQTSQDSQKNVGTASSTSSTATTSPIVLPIKNFTGKVQVDAIYLENVVLSKLDTSLVIKNDDVTLMVAPLQMASEGSQASFETDLKMNLKDISVNMNYALANVDQKILNTFSRSAGLEFEKALFASSGNIKASNALTLFELKNQTSLKDIKLTGAQEIPPLSLTVNLDVGADLQKSILKANEVDAKGSVGEKKFLTADLTKPLMLSWGASPREAAPDSALSVVWNLELADWKGLLQDPQASGILNGLLNLNVADSGNKINVESECNLNSVTLLEYAAAGSLKASGQLTRDQSKSALVGTFKADSFTLQSETLDIKDFFVNGDYQIALDPNILDIQKLNVAWKPTDRAKNEIGVTGQVAYANLAQASRLKVTSESMDFTPQLAWLKSAPETADEAQAVAATEPANTPSDNSLPFPKAEPQPIDLPVKDFECDLDLGLVYLDQMFASNLNANISIKTNVVGLTSKSLNINGGDAKLSAQADLNHPGYRYTLNYDAPSIPAAPIFSFLAPDMPGELASGHIFAIGSISGSGLTEGAIQKNLALQNVCGLTNVSFRPISPAYKLALTPILTLLRISDLADSPILGVYASMNGTNGTFNINSARVVTDAFEADVTGTMNLEPVLMNTPLSLPVTIYLEPKVAEKSNLSSINVRTNDIGFLAMPDFVKIAGTPAAYKINLNEVAIAGLLLKSGVGAVGDVGEGANKIVGQVGGLLVGDSNNTNGVKGIAEGLGSLVGIKKKEAETNDTTDGNALTNKDKPSLGGLFNRIRGKQE